MNKKTKPNKNYMLIGVSDIKNTSDCTNNPINQRYTTYGNIETFYNTQIII
jgi:hypothetical protein